jgi:hypothetical protein
MMLEYNSELHINITHRMEVCILPMNYLVVQGLMVYIRHPSESTKFTVFEKVFCCQYIAETRSGILLNNVSTLEDLKSH